MKSKMILTAATMLMACGMTFANTQGALPATRADEGQSGLASTVNSAYKLPGVVSEKETPTIGFGSNGERPGTGLMTGLTGSASQNPNLLPGVDTTQL
jgi:hypothetical protein